MLRARLIASASMRWCGAHAPHQRMLAEAIKRARNIALLPYTAD